LNCSTPPAFIIIMTMPRPIRHSRAIIIITMRTVLPEPEELCFVVLVGLGEDYDLDTMTNVINLFVTKNLDER
jgi:hypothetical protein